MEKLNAREQVNQISWANAVPPTDCPKSVRNRRVIELCVAVYVVTLISLLIFCWYTGFCHSTKSDLFFFLSIREQEISPTDGYKTSKLKSSVQMVKTARQNCILTSTPLPT